MTCIVGLKDQSSGNVFIGGDSAGVAGLSLTVRKDPKVFTVGEYLIGYTSSFRMGQVLRFHLSVPKQYDGTDDYEHMVKVFSEAVRAVLKDKGMAKNKEGEDIGGQFLVGYRGNLYSVDPDYQIGQPACEFDACGCAMDVARGAMYANEHLRDPKKRIENALGASHQFSAGVRPPFTVMSIGTGVVVL